MSSSSAAPASLEVEITSYHLLIQLRAAIKGGYYSEAWQEFQKLKSDPSRDLNKDFSDFSPYISIADKVLTRLAQQHVHWKGLRLVQTRTGLAAVFVDNLEHKKERLVGFDLEAMTGVEIAHPNFFPDCSRLHSMHLKALLSELGELASYYICVHDFKSKISEFVSAVAITDLVLQALDHCQSNSKSSGQLGADSVTFLKKQPLYDAHIVVCSNKYDSDKVPVGDWEWLDIFMRVDQMSLLNDRINYVKLMSTRNDDKQRTLMQEAREKWNSEGLKHGEIDRDQLELDLNRHIRAKREFDAKNTSFAAMLQYDEQAAQDLETLGGDARANSTELQVEMDRALDLTTRERLQTHQTLADDYERQIAGLEAHLLQIKTMKDAIQKVELPPRRLIQESTNDSQNRLADRPSAIPRLSMRYSLGASTWGSGGRGGIGRRGGLGHALPRGFARRSQ